MQITDPIADMLTRIRNAGNARHAILKLKQLWWYQNKDMVNVLTLKIIAKQTEEMCIRDSCNALYNKFKGAYLIISMLLLTKLFKASPFNIPF